ncbi:PXA domain-containing protein [Stachybotrys elegans]|uniref:PXA domain-containing protein n=1 Tax=Stachybotrys elegans TaxID=80388 RepID=A0A8K0T5M0_9HYPO|nr:PXA domain-containing protein [Stachybotrys elegans]
MEPTLRRAAIKSCGHCLAPLRSQLVTPAARAAWARHSTRSIRSFRTAAPAGLNQASAAAGTKSGDFSFSSNGNRAAEGKGLETPKLRLSQDDLFHPFSSSPVPEFRRRAAFMRQHAYCPHPDHHATKMPTVAAKPEDAATTAEATMAPAHVDFECPDCGFPVYCSKEHWMDHYEEHLEICDTLRQINEDDHDLRSGRVFQEGNLPDTQPDESAVNMTNWDTFMYTREFEAVNSDRQMRQITRLLTYPITIASVLHELSPYTIKAGERLTVEGLKSFSALRYNLHPPKTGRGAGVDQIRPEPPAVRIFVLGARAESSLPRSAWIQLSHMFPEARLHLVFIGPESMANRDDEFPLPERTASNPFGAVVEDRIWHKLKISTIVDYYHTVHKTGYFAPYDPYFDCFMLFHPGLGHPASSHEWEETLPLLLETKLPIISTGYTQFDLERDVEFVHKKSGGEFDVLLEPGENIFRSLRWDLNDLDPQDISCGNWGVWAFRGKRYEATTKDEYSAAPAVSSAAAGRRQSRQSSVDPLSDRGTTLLIRRTLCPQQLGDKARDVQTPIEELLPPLTSSNDVDLQLYAFLAIILREFVQTWYGRITTDETFVAEIVHIIAHCTRALEQRCRTLDLESLLLDEIPDLLDRHITAYRTAHQPVSQPPVQVDPREIYHSLCPLPPLSPVPRPGHSASAAEQEANEKDYRQLLVQGVLALLLPTEDLENPCLTSLVGQILSELIIGNVIANKASQPWLLFEAICILGRLGTTRKEKKSQDGAGPSAGPSSNPKVTTKPRPKWSVQGLFVSVIQFGILAFASIRFVIVALVMSSSVPSRFSFADEKGGVADHHATEPKQPVVIRDKAPVLAFGVWSCISNLIELHLRMPWLNGFLSLLQAGAIYGPGTMAGLDSPLDRDAPLLLLLSFFHLPLTPPSCHPSNPQSSGASDPISSPRMKSKSLDLELLQ